MTQPFIAGLPIGGLEIPGPIPAGMLRIHKGNQERYVWPVHLAGWLGLGWRVAGSVSDPADGAVSQLLTAEAVDPEPDPEPTAGENGPEPATGRGRRGRRRKEEPEQPTAGVEATPEETGTTADEPGATDFEPHAATDLAVDPVVEPVAAAPAVEAAAALSTLPDDLFSDPLI
jgi:hypothetical protein